MAGGPRPEPLSLPPVVVKAQTSKDFAHLPADIVKAAETLAGPEPFGGKEYLDWRRKVGTLIEVIATTRATDSLPKYIGSPLVDSMRAVMGGPDKKKYGTDARGATLGQFHNFKGIDFHPRLFSEDSLPLNERANVHPPSTRRKESLDFVAAHEHGHNLDAGVKASWTIGADFRDAFYPEDGLGRKVRFKVKYREPQDAYSRNHGEAEHFAQAAANAFDFLRVTNDIQFGDNPKATEILRVLLDAREKDIPGTVMLLKFFTENKQYKDHPFRQHFQELYKEFYIPIKKKRK